MPYCPDCGTGTTEKQAFCGECGVSLNYEERGNETRLADAEMSSEEHGKTNITLGLAVSYFVGGLTILVGVSEFVSGFLSGLFMILAGSFVFPPIRRQLEGFLNVRFSRLLVIFLYLVIFGVAAFLNAATRAVVS